jgi:hypothetical protein
VINNLRAVYIAVLNQGEIRTEISGWLNSLASFYPYPFFVDYACDKPISNNRNKIVKRFLASEYDYLMMLDGDIIPPRNVLQLIDFKKDVIGGLCFAYIGKAIIPLILKRDKKKLPGNAFIKYHAIPEHKWEGLTECDAIGSGCIIMSREVLEKVHNPFMNIYDEKTGERKEGLDIAFCRKARKLGYKIYCHTDYRCDHWTVMNVKQVYDSLEFLAQELRKLNKIIDKEHK